MFVLNDLSGCGQCIDSIVGRNEKKILAELRLEGALNLTGNKLECLVITVHHALPATPHCPALSLSLSLSPTRYTRPTLAEKPLVTV